MIRRNPFWVFESEVNVYLIYASRMHLDRGVSFSEIDDTREPGFMYDSRDNIITDLRKGLEVELGYRIVDSNNPFDLGAAHYIGFEDRGKAVAFIQRKYPDMELPLCLWRHENQGYDLIERIARPVIGFVKIYLDDGMNDYWEFPTLRDLQYRARKKFPRTYAKIRQTVDTVKSLKAKIPRPLLES